ncbi:hypothetical protein NE575_04810 [Clostridium sp. SL.3.18]|nr:hypothetical protein [Clostridium sp. SL.3.18]
MRIQTAGEQKYYDFIQERAKRLQTGMIVWGSLLALALICLFSNIIIAVILAVAGAILAMTNSKARRELRGKLDQIEDKEEFFRQLTAPDVAEFPNCHVIIARDYILVFNDDIFIYAFEDMEKVEAGIQGEVKKVLFFADRQGKRHEIISTPKEDGMRREFDRVYETLMERLGR